MRGGCAGAREWGRMAGLAVLIGCLVGSGCARKPQKDAFIEHWDVKAQQSEGYSPNPHPRKVEISKASIVPKKEDKAETKPARPLPTQKVTLRMYDTDLVAVVRAMARAARQNVVLSSSIPGVSGNAQEKALRVNINVEEAPWDETFTSILASNGLTYSVEGDIIRVMTLDDMDKQQKLKEAKNKIAAEAVKAKDLEPSVTARVEINYAELSKIYATLSTMCGAATTAMPGQEHKPAALPGQTVRDITPTSAVDDAIKMQSQTGVRRPGQLNCSVVPDQHSNSIIIEAPQGDAEKLVALIEELDKPRPQVKLKAFIVQTDRDTARQLGIQWGGLLKNSNFRLSPAQTGTASTSTTTGNAGSTSSSSTGNSTVDNGLTIAQTNAPVNGQPASSTSLNSFVNGNPTTPQSMGSGTASNANTGNTTTSATASPLFPGGTSGQGFGLNFPSLNDALVTASGLGAAGAGLNFLFGKIGENVLEAQLTALAAESKIKILSSPTITTMENVSAFVENGKDIPYVSTSQNGTNVQFAHATLKLEMLPHVVDGVNLRMKIVVKDDQVDPNQSNWVQGNPPIFKRETQSNLVVEDGDTIVISGLTRDTVTDSESGVPWLRDIPGVGWAFKTKSADIHREEMLIFVTPVILKEKPIAPVPPQAGPVGQPAGQPAGQPVAQAASQPTVVRP